MARSQRAVDFISFNSTVTLAIRPMNLKGTWWAALTGVPVVRACTQYVMFAAFLELISGLIPPSVAWQYTRGDRAHARSQSDSVRVSSPDDLSPVWEVLPYRARESIVAPHA
jgi:hypothetical protein